MIWKGKNASIFLWHFTCQKCFQLGWVLSETEAFWASEMGVWNARSMVTVILWWANFHITVMWYCCWKLLSPLRLPWIMSASPDGLTSICFPNISFWCIWSSFRRAARDPTCLAQPCQQSTVEPTVEIHRQHQIIQGFCKKLQPFLCYLILTSSCVCYKPQKL